MIGSPVLLLGDVTRADHEQPGSPGIRLPEKLDSCLASRNVGSEG
jgi:hypothetical protein